MELSTSHLACFTMQFRLVGTGSNQPSAHDLKVNSVAYRITSALDFNKRGCVSIANPCPKLLCTEVQGIVSSI